MRASVSASASVGAAIASVHALVRWVGAGVAFRPNEICAVATVRASVQASVRRVASVAAAVVRGVSLELGLAMLSSVEDLLYFFREMFFASKCCAAKLFISKGRGFHFGHGFGRRCGGGGCDGCVGVFFIRAVESP